jgi:DNA-directed RNA polymerase subunit K/omega
MSLRYKANNVEDAGIVFEKLNSKKISKPIMTKYEFDKIIGLRTMQLVSDAIPFVNIENTDIKRNMELRNVAIKELKEGKLPFIIERVHANNIKEYVRVCDLDLVAVKDRMNYSS